ERGYSEPAREAIEAALRLPSFATPPARVVLEPEPETARSARVELGAEVLVPRLGLPGRILAIRDDTVEVEVLGRRVHMPLRELEGATRPTSAERRAAQPEGLSVSALATPRGDVPFQLDLRGLRRDEALERLEPEPGNGSLSRTGQTRIPRTR